LAGVREPLNYDEACIAQGETMTDRTSTADSVDLNNSQDKQSRGKKSGVQVTRRDFLWAASTATGVLLFSDPLFANHHGLPTVRVRIRRAFDLLALDLKFVNFERRKNELVALGGGQSLVIVRFPPQNLAEAIFNRQKAKPGFEETPLPPVQHASGFSSVKPPVRSFFSGPSWIVFVTPSGTRMPLATEAIEKLPGLLCGTKPVSVVDTWIQMMAEWKIRIPKTAETPGVPVIPAEDETRLEIPFRLLIAPLDADMRWQTSSEQLCHLQEPCSGRRSELWHANLLSRKKVTPAGLPPGLSVPPEMQPPKRVVIQARAVWSPDYKPSGAPPADIYYPGKRQLSHKAETRHKLVEQMGKGDGWIDAERIILSSLGANASLSYTTQKTFRELLEEQLQSDDVPKQLAIWKHRMVVGRDVYLLDVAMGWLLPFLQPALYIESTKRRFAARQEGENGNGPVGAYLLKERYILVQDPLKQFGGAESTLGRKMPIKRATIRKPTSPLLEDPGADEVFIPRELGTGKEVRWPVEFQDASGQQSQTDDACLLFAFHAVKGMNAWETDPAFEPYRRWSMPPQKVSFAPEEAEVSLRDKNNIVTAKRTLKNDERLPASKFVETVRKLIPLSEEVTRREKALREELESTAIPAEIERLTDEVAIAKLKEVQKWAKTSIGSWPEEVVSPSDRQAIARLTEDTKNAVADIASKIENAQSAAGEIEGKLKGLLGQLDGAMQASTTLETHAIEFSCLRVDHLFKSGAALADRLRQATSADHFKTLIAALPNQGPWVERIKSEVDSLKKEANEEWGIHRKKVEDYLKGLEDTKGLANKFLTHAIHTQLKRAEIVIPSMKAMTPNIGTSGFELVEDYVAQGISEVGNGVFGKLDQTIADAGDMAKKVQNAVAQPGAAVVGLSRDLGAITGEDAEAIGELLKVAKDFDIRGAIPTAKLFGVIDLSKVILEALGIDEIPQINLVELPEHLEQTWTWTAGVREVNLGILKFVLNEKKFRHKVKVHVSLLTRVNLPKPEEIAQADQPTGSTRLRGSLGYFDESKKQPVELEEWAFALNLLDLIEVRFLDLRFEADYNIGESVKPKIKPRLSTVEFLGPLAFVKDLQDMLPMFGDGFQVVQSPGRIGISYEFIAPPITLGVVTIRALAIRVALMLSLENKPLRFDFKFSSWEEPFELTVMAFGGRGFFRIAIQSDGERELEGALEFGGSLAFDVGVASGGLYVMAGIYFAITKNSTDISGFIRAGGFVRVLGLITASIEFLLMLKYKEEGNQTYLAGIAQVVVSIDLFLFSKDVTIRMEKKIAGAEKQANDDQVAMRSSRSDYYVSLNDSTLPKPRHIPPTAYFARSSSVPGRFDRTQDWNEDYWSQFAF